MKNVIKFPIERQRKDLVSNEDFVKELRQNKIEFCTEIASHYGTMIYNKLNTSPGFALNGTTAVHAWALERGAKILRVHDVKEAKECITLWKSLQ